MGVLDVLPGAISGVYFIYDPEWSTLSLGKLSALRECSLAADLECAGMGVMHYMMGKLQPTIPHIRIQQTAVDCV